jgi:hypothetical protein
MRSFAPLGGLSLGGYCGGPAVVMYAYVNPPMCKEVENAPVIIVSIVTASEQEIHIRLEVQAYYFYRPLDNFLDKVSI